MKHFDNSFGNALAIGFGNQQAKICIFKTRSFSAVPGHRHRKNAVNRNAELAVIMLGLFIVFQNPIASAFLPPMGNSVYFSTRQEQDNVYKKLKVFHRGSQFKAENAKGCCSFLTSFWVKSFCVFCILLI